MKFLIIKPSSLGDVACAMPAVALLKRRYPGCIVDWLVNEEYAGLARAAGADKVYPIRRQAWKSLKTWPVALYSYAKAVFSLPFRRYDYTLDLQGLLRSGLFTLISSHKASIGFADAREGAAIFYSQKVHVRRAVTHAALCNLEILKVLDAASYESWPRFAPANWAETLARFGLTAKKYVIFVPCTRWPSKSWSKDYIAECGQRLFAEKGLTGVLVGSKGEAELCAEIMEKAPEAFVSVAGQTSWEELLALAAQAALAVTPDTGPMHVMAAAGTPMVALMGPTDPRRHGPYGVACKVLQTGRKCLPCYHRHCVLGEEGETSLCMADLTPDMVFEATCELLNKLDEENKSNG